MSQPYAAICPSLEGPVLDVLAHTTRPLTGHEIARLARRGSEHGVRLVLHRLVDHGLVSAQEVGAATLYVLNREHVAASAPRNGSAFRLPPVALIHTCYRITDIDRSVAFYEALGFKEVGRIPIREEAVNVFMNQPGDGDMPRLELTYNVGVESYDLGSGYGHIAITAPDLDAMLTRLAELAIQPEKPPYSVREGGSRLCFVKDPDGYRVEILEM